MTSDLRVDFLLTMLDVLFGQSERSIYVYLELFLLYAFLIALFIRLGCIRLCLCIMRIAKAACVYAVRNIAKKTQYAYHSEGAVESE